ncbi:MAG: MATE family efflux transporter [Cellulosilyticaceae bacterium]
MFKMNVDMTKGNILKGLIAFAIPILISNIFQQLYNTADTLIVGNVLGEMALAAVGASGALFDLLVGFAIGISNGLSIVISRAYGAQNEEMVKRSVAASCIIGIVVTVVITLFSRVALYPLLEVLNTPLDIIDEAYAFISTITLFVGVMFAYNLFAGILRAIGNSVMPLVFLVMASVSNIFLDLVFIIKFDMGIRGAAIATVIAQGLSAVLCLIYILKKCPMIIPQKHHFKVDKALYKELIGQGLSMGLMLSIVSMGTVILQSAINGFGSLVVAGHITARKVNSLCFMPVSTIGMAISTFVSQNKGAGQYTRIRQGIKIASWLSIAWGIIVTVILAMTAPMLIQLISGSTDSTIIGNGTRYLMWNSPFYTVLGILFVLRTSLQGLGQKVIPLISSIIEIMGKILFVIIVIPKLGYFGVIICEPVIWCLMTCQLAFSFYRNPFIRESKGKESDVISI